ncbi:MAG: RpiB/LacA/LacB family sugar-phosphate isomerase, partial [Myxococcales bacterium]|nr:RpiB/LacA/LacB family sugar-phosphate isomerase [Myxococcales bacterium]
MFRFFIANDHAGLSLKGAVVEHLVARGYEVVDLGTDQSTSTDYPDYARALANKVAADGTALGILICGTGQGMAMAANRVKGVRAAVCSDTFSARATRSHNNANVLCL